MKRSIIPLAAIGAVILGGTAAYAGIHRGGDDAARTAGATIPMAQAVATAERHVQGKAIEAELEKTARGPVYDVTVMKDGKKVDLSVDAARGTVIAMDKDSDRGEHEERGEHEDRGEHDAD
jgi:uncharacterized protein YcfJ